MEAYQYIKTMKTFIKSSVIGLALLGLATVTAVGQQIEGGALMGSLNSTLFFGEYHGTVSGPFPLNYFEMKVFPNGYVQGGFGSSREEDDSTEWAGMVDSSGILRGYFYYGDTTVYLAGYINKSTRWVNIQLLSDQRSLIGKVAAKPERNADYAPKGPRFFLSIFADDEDGNNFSVTFNDDGTFDSDFGSGNYVYKKLGRDQGQFKLKFTSDGAPPNKTFILYYTDGDDNSEGVLYDVGASKFYNWEND